MTTTQNIPKVTIVIPCYNQEHYLEECLRSVLAQTASDWEAIVVDDSSTEGDVSALVKRFADPRITAIRHEKNRGLGAARNTGFRAARADFVLPLDSDDKLDPHCLARMYDVAMDGGYDCVFADLQEFGDANAIRPYSVKNEAAMLAGPWLPGPGTLTRKSLWEKTGGYCEDDVLRLGNEDWDFWLTVTEHGLDKVKHIDEPLYWYRVSKGSMSRRLWFDYHHTSEFIYNRHRALFDRHGEGKKFLARGYYMSASTSFQRGKEHRGRAMRLALHGVKLCPRFSAFYPLIGRILLSYLGSPSGK